MKRFLCILITALLAVSVVVPSLADRPTVTYQVPALGDCIISDYNDNVTLQAMEDILEIHVEWIHSPLGQEKEKISTMIAALDLPDIVENFDLAYTKGPDAAIEEGLILRLNELIDEYAPDYKAVLEQYPEAYRQVTTDSGNIWSFACLQPKEEPAWRGPAIRKDLLDQAGLAMPESIEELETILYAFKDMGVEFPLYTNPVTGGAVDDGFLMSAFDIGPRWYMKPDESGKQIVHYYAMEDNFKDYLTLLNKWYNDGILDKEFATRDGQSAESLATQGLVGVYASGGGYGPTLRVQTNARNNGMTSFTLEPFPNLPLQKGGTVVYRNTNQINKGNNTVITTMCEDPITAVKLLNFGYSEQGARLYNYGLEGLTYEMVDGQPKFTELITNNPDGLGWTNIREAYKRHTGAYLRDWAAFPATEFELNCMETWTLAGNDYVMPPVTRTAEESTKYASIMNDLSLFVEENVAGFISGVKSLDEFDNFRVTLEGMGINEVLAIQQAALDRYYNR